MLAAEILMSYTAAQRIGLDVVAQTNQLTFGSLLS